jgi:hypothetical protein
MTSSSKRKNVVVDDEPIPGQQFVLLSYVAPDARQKHVNGIMSLKIRGAFATLEEAKKYAKQLRAEDPLYDIYVAEMGKWLPFPPNPDKIPDQKYAEEFLDSLHTAYTENQELKKKVFKERKDMILKDGLDKHLLPEERLPQPEGPDGKLPAPVAEIFEGNNEEFRQRAGPSSAGAGPSTDPGSSASSSR